MRKFSSALTNPKRFALLLIASIALLAVLFLPYRNVVEDEDDFEIHMVFGSYKGSEISISNYLELDHLSFLMQLYSTSLVPTAASPQEMGDHYFVLKGSSLGERFTILADEEGATLYYAHSGLGHRLRNGDTLYALVLSSCYGEENRAQLEALLNL